MRDEHYWPEWDSDSVRPTGGPPMVDPHEPELVEELLEAEELPRRPPTPGRRFRERLGKVLMVTGGAMGLFVILYTADLMISAGDVPRGVTVAGIDVGGMTHAAAEAKLRQELEPRLTQPVPIRAGDVEAELDPADFGLGLDWPGTLEQAGHQPLDPITRIRSFFTTREVGVATKTDAKTLTQAVGRLAATQLNHPPTEGGIGFRAIQGSDGGVTAFAIEPREGQTLNDVQRAAEIIKAGWLDRGGVTVPVDPTPVKATSAGVHAALDRIVRPAVAKPIVVHGEGADALLKPDAIAGAFQFRPRDDGALDVLIDQQKLQQNLQPQLVSTEKEGKDAQIVFADGGPAVRPSEDARKISWVDTFKPFMEVLTKPEGRDLAVAYQVKRPNVTTEAAGALGIKEVIGEFTTGGFTGDVATNVRTIAAQVNGAIVRPGDTFSLDAHTGPRSASKGYVLAQVNEDGTGPRVISGGISQFTSTLYNAAYFAGLADAEHSEHAYYIDRYPAGRDAKSLEDNGSSVDLKFTADTPTGVAVQAVTSGSTVTVRIWGTRHYRVESATGGQSDFTSPSVELGTPGSCQPQAGIPGFSTTDTRIRYDILSGAEVSRETRTVRYAPRPTIICA